MQVQTTALVAVSLWSCFGSFFICKFVESFVGLRVSDKEEATGLDITGMGERAYNQLEDESVPSSPKLVSHVDDSAAASSQSARSSGISVEAKLERMQKELALVKTDLEANNKLQLEVREQLALLKASVEASNKMLLELRAAVTPPAAAKPPVSKPATYAPAPVATSSAAGAAAGGDSSIRARAPSGGKSVVAA